MLFDVEKLLFQNIFFILLVLYLLIVVYILSKNPRKVGDLKKYKLSKFGLLLENSPYSFKWLITRIIFYPSLAWNIFNYRINPGMHSWWNRIDNYLILGALPLGSTVAELKSEGVQAVVNTCDEYKGPITAYDKHDIKQLWIPVVDFTSPSVSQIETAVAYIEKHTKNGQTVYLHCKAGKGRSVTIALCYLMKSKKISAQEALIHIIKARPQVSKYVWRRPCVKEFANRNHLNEEEKKIK